MTRQGCLIKPLGTFRRPEARFMDSTQSRGRDGRARGWRAALFAAGATVLLAGCQDNIQVRGNIPDQEVVAEIRPGVHAREDIVEMLGSPSTVSTFQDTTWYYVGQKTEQFAFLKPEVIERTVLVISFDETGLVGETRTYTLADGREIEPVGRETPTEGRDLTILQQLFGNIGRFPAETIQNQ